MSSKSSHKSLKKAIKIITIIIGFTFFLQPLSHSINMLSSNSPHQEDFSIPLSYRSLWDTAIELQPPAGDKPYCVAETSDGLFLGTDKEVYRSINGGNWELVLNAGSGQGAMGIHTTSNNWLIVNFYQGPLGFYVSKDGGNSWTHVTSPHIVPLLYDFTELDNGTLLMGNWESIGGIIYSSNDGINWKPVFDATVWLIANGYTVADHAHSVSYDSYRDRIYATFGDYITGPNVSGGKVTLYSDDGGITWNIIDAHGGPISVAHTENATYFGPDWAYHDIWFVDKDDNVKELDVLRTTSSDNVVYYLLYRNGVLYVSPHACNSGMTSGIYVSPDEGKTFGTLVEDTILGEFTVVKDENVYKMFTGIDNTFIIHNGLLYKLHILTTEEVWSLISGGAATSGVWSFDEGSGSVAHDSSGNGNDGTVVNAAWTSDSQTGYALDFNRAQQAYVHIPNSATLNPGKIRIDLWMKPTIPQTSPWAHLLSKRTGWVQYHKGYSLMFNGDGTNLIFYMGNGNAIYEPMLEYSFSSGVWYHLVVEYDGVETKWYVNNNLVQVDSGGIGDIASSGNEYDLFIGAESNGGYPAGQYFDGILDEIKIEDISVTGGGTLENNMELGIALTVVTLLSTIIFKPKLLFNRF